MGAAGLHPNLNPNRNPPLQPPVWTSTICGVSSRLMASPHRQLLPPRLRPWLLLGAALVLYLSMLGQRDIVTSHEARVVQTARQMAQTWPWQGRTLEVSAVELTKPDRGKELVTVPGGRVNPWLVPVLSGKIRLQKPPLPNWCAALTFRLLGFGEGRARLVPALMAALATLLMYDLARVLMGRVAAWVAGLVWLGSYFVFDEYRKAMVDPYLAFFTLAAVWAWVRGAQKDEDGGWRMEDSGEDRKSTRLNSSH